MSSNEPDAVPTRVVPPGRQVRLALTALAVAVGLTVVFALAAIRPAPSPTRAPGTASASPDLAATASTAEIDCRREPGPLPLYLAGDPCPSALLAVQEAIASARLTAQRVVILPGPLFCDVIWEGYGSPAACFGFDARPGQYMHAYISFADSPKVAVVMLGLDLPDDDNAPAATRPPWLATLVAFDVPPADWVMP